MMEYPCGFPESDDDVNEVGAEPIVISYKWSYIWGPYK